jgi:hypothetical protein
MPNGRCRIHGGKSLKGLAHPNFREGRNSKYLYLPARLTPRFEELIGDEIENLAESITIQRTLETTLLEQLDTDETPGAWKRLKRLVADYRKASEVERTKVFRKIAEVVEKGVDQASLFDRIGRTHESQRRLTETLIKARQAVQETYTEEQWNTLLGIVLRVVLNNVPDASARDRIQTELRAAEQAILVSDLDN